MTSSSSTRRPAVLIVTVLVGLLLGAGVVTGIGLAAGTGRLSGPSDQSLALTVLRADQADLATLTDELSDDRRLRDMRTSADAASLLAAQVRDRDADLAVLEDARVRSDAERAHVAALKVIDAFAKAKEVTRDNLDGWDDAEKDAVTALGELDAAAAAVAAMDPERPLRLDTSAIEPHVERTSTYLTESAAKLARYEKRMAKFRRRNRGRLQAAADYKATVLAQVGAYGQTRKDLQEYLDDAKDFNEQIDAFRDELGAAKSRRQGIRSTLASLTPPGAMQGEHAQIISVLDHAIAATDMGVDLADATQDLRDDGDYGTSGFELSEYDAFVEQSEQITRERDAAVGSWTKSIDTYIRRLRNPKGAPKRPTI